MNAPIIASATEKITEADIWRLVCAAFLFGLTAGILLTPLIDKLLRITH